MVQVHMSLLTASVHLRWDEMQSVGERLHADVVEQNEQHQTGERDMNSSPDAHNLTRSLLRIE